MRTAHEATHCSHNFFLRGKGNRWKQGRQLLLKSGGGDTERGSEATKRGEGVGGGFPPSTVGSFFIFRLENMQSGAYLRRKSRLDDMYYIIITLYGIENKPWYNRGGRV